MSKLNIVIPRPNIQELGVQIVGTAPMVQHKWSEKVKTQMLEKHLKKASRARPKRDPKAEFEATLHVMEAGKFKYNGDEVGRGEVEFTGKIGVPAGAIKKAMVSAARNLDGVPMTLLKGAVFVQADNDDNLIELGYKKLLMREDIVRTSGIGRTPDLRFRGELRDWKADFVIKYNADVLSAEQVVSLLSTAGCACGLLEMRPERTGDTYGTFEVK